MRSEQLRVFCWVFFSQRPLVYQSADCLFSTVLLLLESHWCFSLLCPQFVPFRDYMDRTGNHVLSMARLAKDVLAEIPDQFISYMKSRGIKPNPAPPPYTPPGHMHHHTQIWGRPLSVWLRTNSVQLPRSPAGTLCLLFLRWKREPTHQEVIVEVSPRPPKTALRAASYCFSIFTCWFVSFLPTRGCKLSRSDRLKAFFWTPLGSDCLTSDFGSRSVDWAHVVVQTCACLWLFLWLYQDTGRSTRARSVLVVAYSQWYYLAIFPF